MKKQFSLLQLIRDELESERRDLIFLLMICVPVVVALAVAWFHLHTTAEILREVNSQLQNKVTSHVQLRESEDGSGINGNSRLKNSTTIITGSER